MDRSPELTKACKTSIVICNCLLFNFITVHHVVTVILSDLAFNAVCFEEFLMEITIEEFLMMASEHVLGSFFFLFLFLIFLVK